MSKMVQAKLKYAKISPQKARLVANQIRNSSVNEAMDLLIFSKKKVASIIKGVLKSAITNAEHNEGMDIDLLYISSIQVDQGPVTKRSMARAKGRGNVILKKTSHISVKVSEKNNL